MAEALTKLHGDGDCYEQSVVNVHGTGRKLRSSWLPDVKRRRNVQEYRVSSRDIDTSNQHTIRDLT